MNNIQIMLNYISKMLHNYYFTYNSLCTLCFGRQIKSGYLAYQLMIKAFSNAGYILLTCNSKGVNLYKRK